MAEAKQLEWNEIGTKVPNFDEPIVLSYEKSHYDAEGVETKTTEYHLGYLGKAFKDNATYDYIKLWFLIKPFTKEQALEYSKVTKWAEPVEGWEEQVKPQPETPDTQE